MGPETVSFDSAGAPRDLGYDQGRLLADAIGNRTAALGREWPWRAWTPDPEQGPSEELLAAVALDLRRHAPHVDERIKGMALGSGVPRRALVAALCGELGLGLGAPEPRVVGPRFGVPRGLVAVLPRGRGRVAGDDRPGSDPAGCVRRIDADGGLPVLEWTWPWLPGAVVGVNSAGLAAATSVEPSDAWPTGCRVPALLLAQQCLERTASIEAALEWCERRPSGGAARILFADAAGGVVGIRLDEDKRQRLEPSAGMLGCGGVPGAVSMGGTETLEAGRLARRFEGDGRIVVALELGDGIARLRVSGGVRERYWTLRSR